MLVLIIDKFYKKFIENSEFYKNLENKSDLKIENEKRIVLCFYSYAIKELYNEFGRISNFLFFDLCVDNNIREFVKEKWFFTDEKMRNQFYMSEYLNEINLFRNVEFVTAHKDLIKNIWISNLYKDYPELCLKNDFIIGLLK